MVLVCPVQAQGPRIDARMARDLQAIDDFLIKLRHLQEQLNETCAKLSDRLHRCENLQTASDYYYAVQCVDHLGNTFYQIKCDIKYELEKVENLAAGYLITVAQIIKGNSSEKHAECLEVSKKLQRLGDEILSSKSEPVSKH